MGIRTLGSHPVAGDRTSARPSRATRTGTLLGVHWVCEYGGRAGDRNPCNVVSRRATNRLPVGRLVRRRGQVVGNGGAIRKAAAVARTLAANLSFCKVVPGMCGASGSVRRYAGLC